MSKRIRLQAMVFTFAVLLLLISASAATYAWFTYRTDVSMEQYSGTVGKTDGSLLISSSPDGPFDTTCDLNAKIPENGMMPLSTANLRRFFTAAAQNSDGRIISFREADDETVENSTVHGHVYLKCTKEPSYVYLNQKELFFGTDTQVLASARLGLRISAPGQMSATFLFKLDDMGTTAGAESKLTVPDGWNGMIVRSLNRGQIDMIYDPAKTLSAYWAAEVEPEVFDITGKTFLYRLEPEVVADVEYWLYLEGCDIHCQNVTQNGVQNRDTGMALAFYGDVNHN